LTRRGGPSGGDGLGGLRRALLGQRRLLWRRTAAAFGKQIATRQRDAALTGEPIDELPSTTSSMVLDALFTAMP
jgi:hypothetical protein